MCAIVAREGSPADDPPRIIRQRYGRPGAFVGYRLNEDRGWLMTRQDLIIKVPKILPARGCADDIPISPLKINAYCLLGQAGGVRDYE